MQRYYLKHKDDICAVLEIEEETWRIDNAKIVNREIAPFAGTATDASLKQWWAMRAVPSTRKTMEDVVRAAGCINNEEYLAKNLALSVTDAYWISPVNSDLTWKDVNTSVLSLYNDGKMPYHNATSYDRNAALSGQMDKYWDLSDTPPILVKNAPLYYGQQAVNELFATILHEKQNAGVDFVRYTINDNVEKGCKESRCKAFTTYELEFISAYEILHLIPKRNSSSLYDTYIEICSKNGIPKKMMQDYMDYQTLTDFVITNTDEHLNNFGILRDVNTLKFVKPAPIYDSGNSMFYKVSANAIPPKRYELLRNEIVSFHNSEEKMLKHVKNRSIVDTSFLPSRDEVTELYIANGITEQKAEYIASCYEKKANMLNDFQNGLTISMYHEKRRYESLGK